jgi:4-nitrophenyl phosphatase
MDGVLWRASQPIGSLDLVFERIRTLGYRTILATNNATLSPQMYLEKLAGFNVELELNQIINSAMAVVYALRQQYPSGGPVYIIGETGLEKVLNQSGFYQQDDGQVLAVVAGLDRKITYQKLSHAALLIRSGIPFYGTNPDRTYPSPEGLTPGAGAILAAIETATDTAPRIGGKPGHFMFDLALERLGLTPPEVLSIGDRLDTDILGAQQVGCRTGLVLSGITTPSEAAAWRPQPDFICDDLTSLVLQLPPVGL